MSIPESVSTPKISLADLILPILNAAGAAGLHKSALVAAVVASHPKSNPKSVTVFLSSVGKKLGVESLGQSMFRLRAGGEAPAPAEIPPAPAPTSVPAPAPTEIPLDSISLRHPDLRGKRMI